MESPIHPTALIHPQAELEEGVRVGPYSIIGPGVRVCRDTQFDSHAVVEGPTTIGRGCRFFAFASVGQIPQDLKFQGERTELQIGDNNVFREFVTLHRGTRGGGTKTVIGNDNFFMAYVHIAHDCRIGNSIIMGNAATLAGHVVIDDHSSIGAFSGIHQFCRVGRHAFVGGYSVITMDVLPYSKTVGSRTLARCYGPNHVGLQRKGMDPETIRVLKDCFRLLLQSKLNTSQALDAMRKEVPQIEEVAYLLDFIAASRRGIIK
jgi:UDP-N-acetylglucosamine acyltransferase